MQSSGSPDPVSPVERELERFLGLLKLGRGGDERAVFLPALFLSSVLSGPIRVRCERGEAREWLWAAQSSKRLQLEAGLQRRGPCGHSEQAGLQGRGGRAGRAGRSAAVDEVR